MDGSELKGKLMSESVQQGKSLKQRQKNARAWFDFVTTGTANNIVSELFFAGRDPSLSRSRLLFICWIFFP